MAPYYFVRVGATQTNELLDIGRACSPFFGRHKITIMFVHGDSCYSTETLTFHDAAFNSVSCYLITMHGSARRDHYMEQLKKYRPCKTVVILHNPGFRVCSKGPGVHTPAHDLWHANQHIMRIVSNDPRPVLILEDDVEFTDVFRERARDVESFIAQRGVDAFNLGFMPFVSYPWRGHLYSVMSADAHAIIYTMSGRRKIADMPIKWLHDLEVSIHLNMYAPHTPMAVQRKVSTENSKGWNVFGIPLAYYDAFSGPESYYNGQHHMGQCGGIVSIASLVLVVLVALIVIIAHLRRSRPSP